MTLDEQIKQALLLLTQKGKQYIYFGIVKKVDAEHLCCDVEIEGLIFEKIGLLFYEKGDNYGIALIPKKDTPVMLLKLNQNEEYKIIDIQEIEYINIATKTTQVHIEDKKIDINIDKTTATLTDEKIEINAEEILFNGGDNQGLVKVEAMKTKLNNLEKQVNKIVQQLQSISVALAPSGSFPLAPFFSSITPLVETQKTDIENDKIKH